MTMRVFLIASAVALTASPAAAQFYKDKTLTLLVNYGAGGNAAASHVANLAPKDGTTIGAIFPGIIMAPMFEERAGNLFEPTKFNYLATADSGTLLATFNLAATAGTVSGSVLTLSDANGATAGTSTTPSARWTRRVTSSPHVGFTWCDSPAASARSTRPRGCL